MFSLDLVNDGTYDLVSAAVFRVAGRGDEIDPFLFQQLLGYVMLSWNERVIDGY